MHESAKQIWCSLSSSQTSITAPASASLPNSAHPPCGVARPISSLVLASRGCSASGPRSVGASMEVQMALQGQMVLRIWDVEHGACAMLQHQIGNYFGRLAMIDSGCTGFWRPSAFIKNKLNRNQLILAATQTAAFGAPGPVSTGEALAAALILNRPDWLSSMKYTIAEALERIGRSSFHPRPNNSSKSARRRNTRRPSRRTKPDCPSSLRGRTPRTRPSNSRPPSSPMAARQVIAMCT